MRKRGQSPLFTDFYELTMAQGFWKQGMNHPAVFDMFFRRQPFASGFSVFAGLSPLIADIISLRFNDEELAYLESLGLFEQGFLDYLRDFSFSGDLYARNEGSLIFPNEPLIRVHANLIEAQLIEGLILNTINFQSLIATKTARVFLASRRGTIMEFGLRRAQGADGAMSASRAAFIGGAASTSNTLAGSRFGIPIRGTMAHSWIMSFPDELAAFRAYAALYPDTSVFLIDTYETLNSGIKNAIIVGRELAERGKNFGVRLDSGDIQYLSAEVRKRLDSAGLTQATISVSNDLSEHIIENLVSQGAPIDSWGVGTHMVTGGDESAFTGVYKLAARHAASGLIPAMKFSDHPEKTTNPGVKQVWRLYDGEGMTKADILALEDECIEAGREARFYHPSIDYRRFTFTPAKTEALLTQKLAGGKPLFEPVSVREELDRAHSTLLSELSCFDASYTRLLNPHVYKVSITERLKDLKLDFIRARIS